MSEWISVDEQLPNEDQLVVAARLYSHGTDPDAAVCYYFHGEFNLHTDGIEADGNCIVVLDMATTHWMPLPEPPQ